MHVTFKFNFGLGNSFLGLSCVCGWDGWGKDGWVGFCFLPFGYCVEIFFSLNIFDSDSHFMHGVWDFNHSFFPFLIIIIIF